MYLKKRMRLITRITNLKVQSDSSTFESLFSGDATFPFFVLLFFHLRVKTEQIIKSQVCPISPALRLVWINHTVYSVTSSIRIKTDQDTSLPFCCLFPSFVGRKEEVGGKDSTGIPTPILTLSHRWGNPHLYLFGFVLKRKSQWGLNYVYLGREGFS